MTIQDSIAIFRLENKNNFFVEYQNKRKRNKLEDENHLMKSTIDFLWLNFDIQLELVHRLVLIVRLFSIYYRKYNRMLQEKI